MIVWISTAVGLVALCLFTLLAYRGGHARLVEERKLSLCAPVLSEAELQSHLSRLGVGLALPWAEAYAPLPRIAPCPDASASASLAVLLQPGTGLTMAA